MLNAGRKARLEGRQSGRHTRRNRGHSSLTFQTSCFSLSGCSTGTPICPTTPSTSSWASTFRSSSWAPSSTCYFWDKLNKTFGQRVIQSNDIVSTIPFTCEVILLYTDILFTFIDILYTYISHLQTLNIHISGLRAYFLQISCLQTSRLQISNIHIIREPVANIKWSN